jgi:hypothetical protein
MQSCQGALAAWSVDGGPAVWYTSGAHKVVPLLADRVARIVAHTSVLVTR